MKKAYRMPMFKELEPRLIKKVNKDIKKSKYYIEISKPMNKPDINKFKVAYKKYLRKAELSKREYKIIVNYLEKFIDEKKFEGFLDELNNKIDTFSNVRGFVRPLISFIYNYQREDDYKAYNVLKKVLNRLKSNEKFRELYKIISKNDKKTFLNKIKREFEEVEKSKMFEGILDKYKMNTTDKFYNECLASYIVKKFEEKNILKEFQNQILSMDLKLQYKIYEEVMLGYDKRYKLDDYNVSWFELIKKELGDPYSKANSKWNNIDSKCKEIFRRWNNNSFIREFFDKVMGNKRRLRFWKKYIDSIYRIEFYKENNKSLIMEFKNHLFIEFAEVSNAMYYYEKSILDIDTIHKKRDEGKLDKKVLKDKSRCIDTMIHRGEWEDHFEVELKRLGYRIGENYELFR